MTDDCLIYVMLFLANIGAFVVGASLGVLNEERRERKRRRDFERDTERQSSMHSGV